MKARKDVLAFGYTELPTRYVSHFKNGVWDEGGLSKEANVVLSECAGVLHYSQTVFEGLKAYKNEEGKVLIFRPDMNAKRLVKSCERLVMPTFPEERFVEGVLALVKDNIDYVPSYETEGALYIRPLMFATGIVLGVKPAHEYEFRIFGCPVGPYFKDGIKPISLKVSDYDRAAPKGTGNVKAGINYAMSMLSVDAAHKEGYGENLYLDSATRTYVEETGGANVLFIDKKGALVVPKSETILPSITRISIIEVAKDLLGMEVEERPVRFDEIENFDDCMVCGTAAVICPVGQIDATDKKIVFNTSNGMSERMKKLYDTFIDVKMGRVESKKDWLIEVK